MQFCTKNKQILQILTDKNRKKHEELQTEIKQDKGQSNV